LTRVMPVSSITMLRGRRLARATQDRQRARAQRIHGRHGRGRDARAEQPLTHVADACTSARTLAARKPIDLPRTEVNP